MVSYLADRNLVLVVVEEELFLGTRQFLSEAEAEGVYEHDFDLLRHDFLHTRLVPIAGHYPLLRVFAEANSVFERLEVLFLSENQRQQIGVHTIRLPF